MLRILEAGGKSIFQVRAYEEGNRWGTDYFRTEPPSALVSSSIDSCLGH